MSVRVQLVITEHQMVEVPQLSSNQPLHIPADAKALIKLDAEVPNLWVASDVVKSMAEILGNHADAEEANGKLEPQQLQE